MSKNKKALRNLKPMRLASSQLDEDEALVARLSDLLDEGVLSEWEVGFTEDICRQVSIDRRCLTEIARDKVEEILGDKE
jgi:hypothetical protein